MHVLKLIGWGYVCLSLGIALIVFLGLLWEDVKMYRDPLRRNRSKFGYNLFPNIGWSCRWGIGWWMVGACLPGINLLVIVFYWGTPLILRIFGR
jgi:hypothetical protein